MSSRDRTGSTSDKTRKSAENALNEWSYGDIQDIRVPLDNIFKQYINFKNGDGVR